MSDLTRSNSGARRRGSTLPSSYSLHEATAAGLIDSKREMRLLEAGATLGL